MTIGAAVTTKTRGTTFVYRVPRLTNSNTSERFTVVVSNCLTRMINVTPVYEKTGADVIANQVEINFSGIAHGFGEPIPPFLKNYAMGTSSYGTSQFGVLEDFDEAEKGRSPYPATRHLGNLEQVLAALARPRGTLQYSVGDTIIYNVAPRSDAGKVEQDPDSKNHDEFDVDTGDPDFTGLCIDQTPKLEVRVVKVISDTSAHIEVKATFIYQSCNIGGRPDDLKQSDRKDVKSLRWWYADDISGINWATKRMIRGRLEIYDRNELNVMTLRRLVLPPIEFGFRRESISIREQEDGLAMDFEIMDVEVYAHAPYPASDWDGQTRVTFPRHLVGPVDIASQIMLEAPIPKKVKLEGVGEALFPTKEHLVHLLIHMLDSKLHWHRQITGGNVFTKQLDLSESMKHNRVEASLGIQVVVSKEEDASWNAAHGADNFRKMVRAVFGNDMSHSKDRKLGYGQLGGEATDESNWGAWSSASNLGHKGGIKGYDRRRASYWQPHDGSLKGIFRCALQNPCSVAPNTLSDLQNDDRSEVGENQNKEQETTRDQDGKSDQGAKVQKEYKNYNDTFITNPTRNLQDESVYRDSSNETILSKLTPSNKNPYFSYDLNTSYRIDNGVTTFPSKGPYVGAPQGFSGNGRLATTVAHYTQGSTAEVTIEMQAARLDSWPTTPTDQSWVDPVTGIMYMCKGLEIFSSSVEVAATGNHRMFNCGARVTYVLSRAPRWFEDIRVSCAPFIVSAGSNDSNVRQQIENYVGSIKRKSGARYTPTNNTGGEG